MQALFVALLAQAQFVTAIGGTRDDVARALVTTADGGYALAGETNSFGADSTDVLLAKFDSTGALQWARTLGGTRDDVARSLVQTADGGYALAGETNSFGAGADDVLLAKFDSAGALQWARTLGSIYYDLAYSLVTTTDGGYAVAGGTLSFGAGADDAFLAKYDGVGTLLWVRTIGGAGYDWARSLVQTADGGYALAGETDNFGAEMVDVLLVKLDGVGTLQWARMLGDTYYDRAYSLVTTADGGYAVAGETGAAIGDADFFLAKFDSAGTLQWTRVLGGFANDYAYSLVATTGGGYAVAGYTESYSTGLNDALLAKYDGAGTLLWVRTIGGAGYDWARSLVQTADGGYALAGETDSLVTGSFDVLLAKFDAAGVTCIGNTVNPTVSSPSPTVTSPSPTITSPSPTVTSPSPTVTSPAPVETKVCYSVAVTERSPAGATPRLTARLVRGGLSISAAAPTLVMLYRADGRLVRTLTVTGTARVALRAGVYVLRDERSETLTAVVAR